MARPVPGRLYVVQTGDNLSRIASIAYGDSTEWRRIWSANINILETDDPDQIPAGTELFIPELPRVLAALSSLEEAQNAGNPPDKISVIIAGVEVRPLTFSLVRSMEAIAGGWSITTKWTPGEDARLDQISKGFTYNTTRVYIGPILVSDGLNFGFKPRLTGAGRTATYSGGDRALNIVDSNIRPPYEYFDITLKDLAIALCEPWGIDISVEGEDEPFDQVTFAATDKVGGVLARLASQRGYLLNSTLSGALVFRQAVTGDPVGTLNEESENIIKVLPDFDGRKRFAKYRVLGQAPAVFFANAATASDPAVQANRLLTMTFDDTTTGNIQKVADWRRSKQIAEAVKLSVEVKGWYAPDGSLWRENTLINLVSKTALVPDGFDFLIKEVNLTLDADGFRTILELTVPQAYTGEELREPWL